jgi:phosphate-selective porin OprO and OprP
MKSIYRFLVMCLIVGLGASAYGQVRNVTGQVTSDLDGEAVEGVSVRLKGAITAVTTNADGRYAMEVPENSSMVLVFTHEDHDSQELVIGGRSIVNVELVNSVRYNQYGRRVNRTPLAVEERDGILMFESPDQDYRMWLDLRVQGDGSFFFGDTYNDIGNAVAMRRVRMAFKTELGDRWEAELDMNFADALADLKDAFLLYKASPRLDIKVGNYKERFSMEGNTSSRWLSFMERPAAVRAIAPSRHIGLQFHYHRPYFVGVGGLHFQEVGDYEVVQNRKDNQRDYGWNEGYSLTGKLTFIPYWYEVDRGLHFALAGSYRTPKTHVSGSRFPSLRYDSRSNNNINRKKYLDTNHMLHIDDYILYNLEFAGNYKGLRVQTEYIHSTVNRLDDNEGNPRESETFGGFYIMGSYLLFGGTQLYNNYQGEYTQPINGKSWGDIELAFRYDFTDFNNQRGDNPDDWGVMGGSGEGFTFAVNYYAPKNVKLQLNYGYLNFDRYANRRGDAFIGYDNAGTLTRDPFAVDPSFGEPGERFHFLALRFQVAF